MGLLTRRSPRELLARRGGAIVVVTALHVGVVAYLLHMKYVDRVIAEPEAIQVANFQAMDQDDEPSPEVEVQLMPPPEFEVVVPLVNIHLDTPPPTALTPPPPPPPRASAQPAVLRDAMPPMLSAEEVDYLSLPQPVYPRSAKLARVEGTVLLWVLIDPEGKPKEVRIHRTSGSEQLDRAGLQAVMACQFKPTRRNGVALSATAVIPINFVLSQGRRRRPEGPPADRPHDGRSEQGRPGEGHPGDGHPGEDHRDGRRGGDLEDRRT